MGYMSEAAEYLDTQRSIQIEECVDDIRSLVASSGVTGASLTQVKIRLLQLAAKTELFNTDIFPVQKGDSASSLYLLSEDENHEYAFYAVSEITGNMSPPHDHTTWAVIAGIEGEELNKFYLRLDRGEELGRARIEETHSEVVGIGTGVTLMPEDIHSIHCLVDQPTLNFHFYGRSIEHLPKRKAFNMSDGTYRYFPANPHIYKCT